MVVDIQQSLHWLIGCVLIGVGLFLGIERGQARACVKDEKAKLRGPNDPREKFEEVEANAKEDQVMCCSCGRHRWHHDSHPADLDLQCGSPANQPSAHERSTISVGYKRNDADDELTLSKQSESGNLVIRDTAFETYKKVVTYCFITLYETARGKLAHIADESWKYTTLDLEK